MPYYDFFCKECKILVEDEFFKITDEKIVECGEGKNRMKQVILKAPGLSEPGGTGQKWTNDGYQMKDEKSGNAAALVLDVKDDAADPDDTGIGLSQGRSGGHGHPGQNNQRRNGPGNRAQIQLA